MKLGQHLKVRKFEEGGTAETNCEATEGAVWTGFTCDLSGVTGHEMTGVESQTGSQFEDLSGMTGASGEVGALASYLQETYGLQDAQDYLKSFEAYDPFKEQELQKSYQFGMGQAQTGAREQMGDIYKQARARGSKGGGFGGAGKTLSQMKGKTLGGLESQQEKMGRTFTGGVQGLREDYVDDWLGQITTLGTMGAKFCKEGETWVETDSDSGAGECQVVGTS